MKKLLAILVVLCMVIGVCPVISFAENATVNAERTVYFDTGSTWSTSETSGDGGGVSVLVAWNGSNNWQGATSFTDTNGDVTVQSVTSGTSFTTSRNALIAFTIPENFDADKVGMVTLGFSVKKIKQVATGVRFAVYGNSVDGTWSTTDSNKTAFGANGTDSGLSALPLLGLTTPVETGVDGEKVSLASYSLTDYVKKMAQEGKREVTFRIAIPYGGAWIYNAETDTPPTLKIEEGVVTTVNVKTVFYDGEDEVSSSIEVVENVVSGSEYEYTKTPETTVVKGQGIFVYSKERSTLSVIVDEYGSSEIIIAYEKRTDENSFDGYEIEDEGAWCWFGDPRAVSFKNEEGTIDVTVIGYIDVHGSIKATQINNLTKKVDEVLIRTNIQPDDHNNPTFVMVPDGRIVVFYSRHTDEACFWYRVTEKPGDITTFGEEKCLETANNTTYPSPFVLSDDPDNIYLCWRGIEWHPTIAKLSLPDENGDMEFTYGPYQLVRSSNVGANVRPYAKYASNGKDKIFMSYTGTHPDNYNPNWLYCNYIDINTMTMHDINGKLMRTIANGPLIVDHSEQSHIVDKTSNKRNWLWQVALDKDGNPVIANVRIDSGKTSHDYYYIKWNGTEWVKTFLTNAGGKFHPSNTEYCYSGGMGIDSDNPEVIYCSKPTVGVFGKVWEIFKYTMSEDGTEIVSTEQITKNSLKNNVRPWVIPNSEGDDLRVMWMNGDYDFWMVNSNYPAGYPTRIMGEVELPKEEVDLSDAVVIEDYDDIGGAFVSTTETANVVTDTSLNGSFTVSANIYLDGDYEGDIFDLGNMKLSVKNMPTKYGDDSEPLEDRPRVVLTLFPDSDFETEFITSNVFGTSDEWKNHDIRTGGEYFFTEYDRYVNHTISYDGEYLTLYRDGLIDLKEKVDIEGIEYVYVGGFDGLVEDVDVYERALNHDEIAELCEKEYAVIKPDVEVDYYKTISYVAYEGQNVGLGTCEKIKPSKEIAIYPGSDSISFEPEKSFVKDGIVYTLLYYKDEGFIETAYAVYKKNVPKGDNLVTDGSFEDSDGNFSWGTWQTPRTDGGYNNSYYKDNCNDWFYKVNRDTNASALYKSGSITAEDYALGTRWNDGSLGTCSLANFIEVEKGKTYYVAYDYKHSTQGADASYISTAFVAEKDFALNASGNNVPKSVTTAWQTNEFAITAEEDGYIYFHFSWLGNANNAGNGPYWYFDNFKVFEIEPQSKVVARLDKVTETETIVHIENVFDDDVTGIKVYAVKLDDDNIVVEAETSVVDITYEELTKDVEFKFGGHIKVFIWDENMEPMCEAMEENYIKAEVPVMVVTKVAKMVSGDNETYRLTGVIDGETVYVDVKIDEKESAANLKKGNVIIYAEEGKFVKDIKLLFDATKDAPADDVAELDEFSDIVTVESDENVSIHYGEITDSDYEYVEIDGSKYNYTDDVRVIVVDYSYNNVSIKSGKTSAVKVSSEQYKRSAFVKTLTKETNVITDVVVFIEKVV